ncbi:MAG: RDD family protein [Oscillospiraceae bacterium]|nr:RDD family protein [Oscillospiraceae bacterium]
MKAEVNGRQIELEPNSRPYLLKRIIADGFDVLLLFALFMLLMLLILRTPAADAYHEHAGRAQAIEAETAAALQNDAEAVSAALSENGEYRDELFAANLRSYVLKAAACLLAELLLFVAVPLLNRSRATPGKLMTGIMPFNVKRQSAATVPQILYRFLFVLLIDSLPFYLYAGIYTFLLVPILRLTELLMSRKNRTVCDLITGITIIEKLSFDGV